MRAPERGRKIRTGDLTRGMDYCRVWLESRTVRRNGRRLRTGRRLIVSIPLTQRGAVYLDEQEKTGDMMVVLAFASRVAEERGRQGTPTADELLSAVPPGSNGLVGLTGPAETPPAGAVGYWSDGAEHVAVVTLSASGRRLFIEHEGDVVHTNVGKYLYNDVD